MELILLTGMPGAGKEEFLKIAKDRGYEIIRMGDVVRKQAEMVELDEEMNIGEFADKERKEHHEGIWADRTMSRIQSEKTIIDGLRSPEELSIFRSELEKDAPVVAIHSSPKTRFKRLKDRGREDAPQKRNEFHERDKRELEWGLGKIIARADHMIVNEGTLSEFHEKTREFLKDFSEK